MKLTKLDMVEELRRRRTSLSFEMSEIASKIQEIQENCKHLDIDIIEFPDQGYGNGKTSICKECGIKLGSQTWCTSIGKVFG